MKNVRTLIVDDHEIIRYALRQLFERATEEYSVSVVGEAENGREAVALAHQLRPELVIMDISMPEMNGVEATRQIRSQYPECRVVILTTYDRPQYLRELIQAGISGYVLKTRVFHDLFEAIRSALHGELYLCSKAAQQMSEDYARIISRKEEINGKTLSPRQKEVLQLIVEGKGTKDIAAALAVSAKAIESVRHRLMRKLEMDNLAALTKYALREGLTTLDF